VNYARGPVPRFDPTWMRLLSALGYGAPRDLRVMRPNGRGFGENLDHLVRSASDHVIRCGKGGKSV